VDQGDLQPLICPLRFPSHLDRGTEVICPGKNPLMERR
jgi:hypothetical protein